MQPVNRQPTFSAGQTSRFSNIQTVVTSRETLSSCFLVLKHCGGSSPGCSDSAPLGCSPQIMFNSPPALLRLRPPCVNPIKFHRIAAYWSLLLRRRWRRSGGGGVWNRRALLTSSCPSVLTFTEGSFVLWAIQESQWKKQKLQYQKK